MKRTILFFLLIMSSFSFAQSRTPVNLNMIDDAIGGDNPHTFYPGAPAVYNDIPYPVTYSAQDLSITLNEVNINARTYYDFQSNAGIKYIWQEFDNPAKLHAVFMVDQVGIPPNFLDRRTRYFMSSDTGNTWTYVAEIPDGVRSGFPGIISLSDNRQVIMNQTYLTDGSIRRTQLYINASSGSNVFTRLDPGPSTPEDPSIWPVGIPTSSITNQNKIVFITSNWLYPYLAYTNICSGLDGTGTFTGFFPQSNILNAQCYALARGPNGKIGLAYIANPNTNPYLTYGSVYFVESQDNGTTWGYPVPVWISNYYTDSIACLKSVDVVYQGMNPKVIFNLCKQTGYGGFLPNEKSRILFWSPNINNGIPLQVDEAPGLNGTNPTNDGFTSVCRGAIGVSSDDGVLYAAYNKARTDISPQGNNYFDIFFTYSIDGGLNWSEKTRVTNNSGPLRDCRYVSISPTNNFTSSGNHFAHLIYQQDSIAGSYVMGSQSSLARMMYARIKISDIFTFPIKLNLKVLMEGMYYSSSNWMLRNDTVTVYLRNASLPYSLVDSVKALIDKISFSGSLKFSNTPSGTYYLVVKHHNCIETWSKEGGELLVNDGSTYNYDFTNSITKAYGNNLKLKGASYCMFSGDVDNSGTVDLTDVILIYNDANNFVTGYAVTDLTGNNITDLQDIVIAYNNSSGFVCVMRP